MCADDGESEHILASDYAPFYRLVLAGKLHCARCGTRITLSNEGSASWGTDENCQLTDLNAHCLDCTRIVTRKPES